MTLARAGTGGRVRIIAAPSGTISTPLPGRANASGTGSVTLPPLDDYTLTTTIHNMQAQAYPWSTIWGLLHESGYRSQAQVVRQLRSAGWSAGQIRQVTGFTPSFLQGLLSQLGQSVIIGPSVAGALGPAEAGAAGAGESAAGAGAATGGGALKKAGMFGAAAAAIGSTEDFLKFIAWIFHPVNILRAVEFVVGLGLIVFGAQAGFQAFRESPRGGRKWYGGGGALRRSGLGRATGRAARSTRVGQAGQARRQRRAGRQSVRSDERARRNAREYKRGQVAEQRRQRTRTAKSSKRSNRRQAQRDKRRGDEVPF